MTAPRFTGEYFVPGESPDRIEADHLARYEYAKGSVTGQRVLDIACGSGYGTHLLATSGATSTIGVDISPAALSIARERSSAASFVRADIATFGVAEPFDVITCFETIEHVPDADAALVNLRRLLRLGGTLYISSPNRPITSPDARSLDAAPANRFHAREYEPPELRTALERAGFGVEPSILGQRRQPRLPARLRRQYQRRMRPEVRASSGVRPIRPWMVPRYFLLVAH